MDNYLVVGVMSGTSLDGLDLALCSFSYDKDDWSFEIHKAKTIPYTAQWLQRLQKLGELSAFDFLLEHKAYGRYIGEQVLDFLENETNRPTLIASHGHTVFHQPEKKFTFQIGDGAEIAATTGISCVSDFRSFDVALGGQGAPLVPIGDQLLFGEYPACINLGGFANISMAHAATLQAFDICPANIVLNELTQREGKLFDKNGTIGQSGEINSTLLEKLNNISYYQQKAPKSLGKEWVDEHIFPLLEAQIPTKDLLRTFYEHIAIQIAEQTKGFSRKQILFTGGGVHNRFLMNRIKANSLNTAIVPDSQIVNYKEALIFAFLGVLRTQNKVNCLASVTGATQNNIGGVVHRF